MNENRRHFRHINATEDIVGAKADTFVHTIRSNRRVDPNVPAYTALNGQRVDSSAVSVGKSIVFAELIKDHEMVWKKDNATKPYVVAGVGNVGLTAVPDKKEKGGARRSTAPTQTVGGGGGSSSDHPRTGGTPGADAKSSNRMTPAEKKQIVSRQAEIQLVRELS